MREKFVTRTILICAAGLCAILLSAVPSSAQDDLGILVRDVKAHLELCNKVAPSQTDLFQHCANAKAALIARQHDLGVSDKTINDALNPPMKPGEKARGGWRWP